MRWQSIITSNFQAEKFFQIFHNSFFFGFLTEQMYRVVFQNNITVARSANKILHAREPLRWCTSIIGHVDFNMISGLILLCFQQPIKTSSWIGTGQSSRSLAQKDRELWGRDWLRRYPPLLWLTLNTRKKILPRKLKTRYQCTYYCTHIV